MNSEMKDLDTFLDIHLYKMVRCLIKLSAKVDINELPKEERKTLYDRTVLALQQADEKVLDGLIKICAKMIPQEEQEKAVEYAKKNFPTIMEREEDEHKLN